ncbi:MAG: ABC transporter ATP-binding protein [Planctomycetota bacterium]|nr:ABC transporter ATP-binding protein [Planctomycetota bacterium]MCZ6815134.1 ABC transporter ATP-binding protein [Planctomycetota bacterium]
MNSNVVTIENLHKCYRLGNESIPALRGVSLGVEQGRFVAIMGPSGCGKTTLLNLLGGLDMPDTGRILIAGRNITAMRDTERTLFRRRRLGIIFQAFNLLPNLTARENVMLPLLVDGRPVSEIAARADKLIEMVHLENRIRHRPAAMSGGEQQRVAIARSLMNEPELVLADEPTGNLDPTSSMEIWALLRELSRETSTTIVMVTHEATAAAHADRVHVLKNGQFVGTIEPEGSGDASLVATRYAKLAD